VRVFGGSITHFVDVDAKSADMLNMLRSVE